MQRLGKGRGGARHGKERRRCARSRARTVFVAAVAVVVHVAAIAALASAIEIGCAGSNRNPAACSEAECIARYTTMKNVCDQPASCTGISGCAELQRRLALHQQCIQLRNFQQECFFLPEPGHEIQVASRQNGIAKCNTKIALPVSQGGCADPCP